MMTRRTKGDEKARRNAQATSLIRRRFFALLEQRVRSANAPEFGIGVRVFEVESDGTVVDVLDLGGSESDALRAA